MPLGFWRFHQALEAQHAAHTVVELEEAYAAGAVTDLAKASPRASRAASPATCAVFWDGLGRAASAARRRRLGPRLPRVERARDLRPFPTLPASSGSQRDAVELSILLSDGLSCLSVCESGPSEWLCFPI